MSLTSGCGENQSYQARGQGRGARNVDKSRGNGLFVLVLTIPQYRPRRRSKGTLTNNEQYRKPKTWHIDVASCHDRVANAG